jgi:signal transduction histidine kinase
MSMYRSRYLSLRIKSALVLGGLQVIGLLVLGYIAYARSQDALEDLAEDKFRLGIEAVSKSFSDYIRAESRKALFMANMQPVQAFLVASNGYSQLVSDQSRSQLENLFMSMADTHPECAEIVLMDGSGREQMRILVEDGVSHLVSVGDLRLRPAAGHFRETISMAKGNVYVSPLRAAGPEGSIPTFWVAAPVVGAGDQTAGTIAVRVDPRHLLTGLTNPVEQGRAFIVDQHGRMLYRSPEAAGLGNTTTLVEVHPRLAAGLASQQSASLYVACEPESGHGDGAHRCMHGAGKIQYDPLSEENYWAVIFDAPTDVIFAPSKTLRNGFLILGTVVIGISLALTLVFSRSMVVEPVLSLSKVAERVAGGDLRIDLQPYPRKDEIGQLYAAFNIMVNRLREATDHLQDQIRSRTAELEHSEAQLEQQNEQLVRLSSYKSHLLSVVSHELKTPLASLDGFSRIINQMFLTDEFLDQTEEVRRETLEQVRKRVEIMGHNTARLIRLVDDLLDFSRIDRGQGLQINRTHVDLAPIVQEVVESYREMGAKQGIEVSYLAKIEPSGLKAEADGDRIAQVLGNLLDNALKFTDSGGNIQVDARVARDEQEFQVVDSGEGIEPEALQRIFNLFEQAGNAVSRKQGTGIGLAISRYIIERHDGYIRAQSDGPKKGSRFSFGIPRRSGPTLTNDGDTGFSVAGAASRVDG